MSSEEIKCPTCDNLIGYSYDIDGVMFLDCGGLIVRELKSNCKQCGREFFWVVPNIRLERLIKRVLKNRKQFFGDTPQNR